MPVIRLNHLRIYAHHGCWPEEEIIGGDYTVDVAIDFDFTEAALQDDLSKTIDYVRVNGIVQHEMKIRAKLIEHVAHRIVMSLRKEFPASEKIWVRLTKMNAPMQGQVESVSVEMEG
ncbi:MAG: dihydroneopterin aldolase [Flavobacteriales bacterium]|nr:dihydroneopterin aldolase [Flavobacteriales bacterium]